MSVRIIFHRNKFTMVLKAMTFTSWWCHQMETFSALLAICAGNSPVTGEFPAQRPVTRSFDFFFDLCLDKRLSKQWWGWWFETHPKEQTRILIAFLFTFPTEGLLQKLTSNKTYVYFIHVYAYNNIQTKSHSNDIIWELIGMTEL